MGKLQNQRTFYSFYKKLYMLAISRFEWQGLPDTCNAEFLEKTLFHYGRAMFCKPKDAFAGTEIINVQCEQSDMFTVYEQPKAFRAVALGLQSEEYSADEVVVVYNNIVETGLSAMSTMDEIQMYAYRLMQIQRTMDININGQKYPLFIVCDEKQRLTMENIYKKYEGNEPIIYGANGIELGNIKAIKTDVPYLADRLHQDKVNIWNEALAYLGINSNPSPDKRERQIVSEVQSNSEQTNYFAESYLLCRQKACEQLNKKFGLNASVKMRKITKNEIQTDMGFEYESEDENG